MIIDSFKEKASVQYNDYSGYISIDGHGGGLLHQICTDFKVDEKYFPVAFDLHDSSLGEQVPYNTETTISIYAINKEESGEDFDSIAKSIRSNNGVAKVSKIDIPISYSDLSKYIKRMGIFAIQKGMENVIREFEEADKN